MKGSTTQARNMKVAFMEVIKARYGMATVNMGGYKSAIEQALKDGMSQEAVRETLHWLTKVTEWRFVPAFDNCQRFRENLPKLYDQSQQKRDLDGGGLYA